MPTQQLTADNYLRLYPVVGEIVVQWGLTDLGLKRLHELGSAPKPVSWDKLVGRRLRNVEEMFNRPTFSPLARDAVQIFQDIRHVLELRLFLIHGAPILYEPLKDAVIFERMDRPNQQEITANPERTQIARRLLVRFSTLKETADLAARLNVALGKLEDDVANLKGHKPEGER